MIDLEIDEDFNIEWRALDFFYVIVFQILKIRVSFL